MKRGLKISLLVFLFAVIALNIDGFAMAKRYTHFVDSNYEGKTIKGQPNGQRGTRWLYKTDELSIIVNYPANHRVVEWPLKQWVTLSILPLHAKRATFKFVKWKLINENGSSMPMFFGEHKMDDTFYEKEHVAYGNPIPFYLDISPNVQELTLNFKIEIKMHDGSVHIVEEKIPLKKASFEVGLFEK